MTSVDMVLDILRADGYDVRPVDGADDRWAVVTGNGFDQVIAVLDTNGILDQIELMDYDIEI